ncbi:MAG: hypothetical protein EZS28_015087 [Streblomastix strix]|uniref:Uncharacterized protein n=1 Tax=Streblomastix strix TaxID=222440 RepID=A0A5J4W3V3_9EUKA|nr:MAG: hypothetical protein EZS28_015087 [Streblomastix strix]
MEFNFQVIIQAQQKKNVGKIGLGFVTGQSKISSLKASFRNQFTSGNQTQQKPQQPTDLGLCKDSKPIEIQSGKRIVFETEKEEEEEESKAQKVKRKRTHSSSNDDSDSQQKIDEDDIKAITEKKKKRKERKRKRKRESNEEVELQQDSQTKSS